MAARTQLAFTAVLTVMAGCSMTLPNPATAKLDNLTKVANLPGKPSCFWKSNFQGDWTVLNDSTLIVRAPLAKDAYVVKLFEPVFDLNFKQGLGFEDREHTGQICNSGDDYLLVPGWAPPEVPKRIARRGRQARHEAARGHPIRIRPARALTARKEDQSISDQSVSDWPATGAT
jgi:hypothetical protein